LLAWV